MLENNKRCLTGKHQGSSNPLNKLSFLYVNLSVIQLSVLLLFLLTVLIAKESPNLVTGGPHKQGEAGVHRNMEVEL